MPIVFDEDVQAAIFSGLQVDGTYQPEVAEYLKEMGQTRNSVVLAFAPKAAGTFLRTAAIAATDGQLVRTVQAQGGRDAQFYLPSFLMYYAGGFPSRPLITHAHMQALPANRYFIEALDLKPVIMIRSIPDMLLSYLEMIESDPAAPENWLNIQIPQAYAGFADEAKGDFVIDMLGPWYASYFATWLDWARRDGRVLVLDYDEFRADPLKNLECLLLHSRFQIPRERCSAALNEVWEERRDFRYRQGVSGRGRARFNPAQVERLRRMLAYYPVLESWMDRLIPPPSAASEPGARSSATA
jgi:Sulfotransferase domain